MKIQQEPFPSEAPSEKFSQMPGKAATVMEIADRSGCTSVTASTLALKHVTVLPLQSISQMLNRDSPDKSTVFTISATSLPTFHTEQVLFNEMNTIQLVRPEWVLRWTGEELLALLVT